MAFVKVKLVPWPAALMKKGSKICGMASAGRTLDAAHAPTANNGAIDDTAAPLQLSQSVPGKTGPPETGCATPSGVTKK